ncbi:hypothetical protein NE591_15210, partial [Adlercreutzia sp. DFI.6.23]
VNAWATASAVGSKKDRPGSAAISSASTSGLRFADAFEEDRQKALRSGMNGHLTKPVEIDKLFKALDELLS